MAKLDPVTLTARRVVCRALDIDTELPSAALDDIFAVGNVRGEFAVQEVARSLIGAEQRAKRRIAALLRREAATSGWAEWRACLLHYARHIERLARKPKRKASK